MQLHHFTSWVNYLSILRYGIIRPTESNVSRRYSRYGPDVVWLTSNETSDGLGIHPDPFGPPVPVEWDRENIRLTVEVDNAEPWKAWANRQNMGGEWRHQFEQWGAADSWWVVERPVPTTAIIEVVRSAEVASYIDAEVKSLGHVGEMLSTPGGPVVGCSCGWTSTADRPPLILHGEHLASVHDLPGDTG